MGRNPDLSPTFRRAASLAASSLLALASAACGTAPVDQIRHFSQAFNTVNTVGQPLLDDLAVAERAQGRQVAVRRSQGTSQAGADDCPKDRIAWQKAADGSGIIRGFCLGDAGYFSALDDPPATAKLRGGLLVIERYADVLASLAEGRNADEALGQINALGQDVGGLLGIAGIAAGPIGPVLGALQPILKTAARSASAAEARRLVLEGAPVVTRLIAALREAAPAMFDVLIESSAQKLVLTETPAEIAAEVARVDARRLAVANYVVLLGKLQAAWEAAVAAASAPASTGGLASLAARSAELRADAEAARRINAVLRAGGVPSR